jgi:FAD/FMN-containing dehydrogenase
VVLPADTAQVAAVVQACAAAACPVVPQGGNTGLCGGAALADGAAVVVNLSPAADPQRRCRQQRHHRRSRRHAGRRAGRGRGAGACSPGPGQRGQLRSRRRDLHQRRRRAGAALRQHPRARARPRGRAARRADLGRPARLRKDNTGYDLKQLFIGAEGTLGIVTAATLKLFAVPRQSSPPGWRWLRRPPRSSCSAACARGGDRVTAFELISRPSLELVLQHIPGTRDPAAPGPALVCAVELTDTVIGDDLAAVLEAELAAAIADGASRRHHRHQPGQATALWNLRENISEAQKREGVSIKHDIAVPVSAIPEFLDRAGAGSLLPGLRIVAFGHVGDGNLHYNQSRPHRDENDAFIARTEEVGRVVHDLVHELGGSISAEHGIGQLKRALLPAYKPAVELDLMHRIKYVLDPRGLMNPGKVLQGRRAAD